MKHIKIFVYKKNLDLDCLSAYEAIKQFMGKEKCLNLKRFVTWNIAVESDLDDKVIANRLTESSYHLLNPNKEGYYINSLPNLSPNTVVLESQNKLKSEFDSIAAKLSQVSGVSIKTLHKRITWLCKIDSLTMNEAIDYVEEHLLSTRSYKQGILINPIYETYEILR